MVAFGPEAHDDVVVHAMLVDLNLTDCPDNDVRCASHITSTINRGWERREHTKTTRREGSQRSHVVATEAHDATEPQIRQPKR